MKVIFQNSSLIFERKEATITEYAIDQPKMLNAAGKVINSSSLWKTSEVIPVSKGDKIYGDIYMAASNVYLAAYSNADVESGTNIVETKKSTETVDSGHFEYIVGDGITHIVVCSYVRETPNQKVYKES